MSFDSLFLQTSVLGTAMKAVGVRNDVIQNNIANVDTPGFKKSTVDFEGTLQKALEDAKRTGDLDLSTVTTSIRPVNTSFSYRLDGNNVDIDTEMTDLYINSVRYDILSLGVNNYYERINMVLTK